MEPDAVQTQNKPFECRVILLGALKGKVNSQFSMSKSKQIGKIVHYCCPAFLLCGPILMSMTLGIIGGAMLGLGLVGLTYRVSK